MKSFIETDIYGDVLGGPPHIAEPVRDDSGFIEYTIKGPACLVVALNGYDVVRFDPYRRVLRGVSREAAEARVEAECRVEKLLRTSQRAR